MAAKQKRKNTKKKKVKLDHNLTIYIYGIIAILLSLLALLHIGFLGDMLSLIIRYIVGNLYGVVCLLIIIIAIIYMIKKTLSFIPLQYSLAIIIILLGWLIACALPNDEKIKGVAILSDFIAHSGDLFAHKVSAMGGLLGALIVSVTTFLIDYQGSRLIVIFLFIIAAILIISGTLFQVIKSKASQATSFVKEKGSQVKEKAKEKAEEKKKQKELEKAIQEENGIEMINVIDDEKQEEEVKPPAYGIEIITNQPSNHSGELKVGVKKEKEENNEGSKIPTIIPQKKKVEDQVIIEKTIGKKDDFVSQFAFDFKDYQLPSIRLLDDVSKNSTAMDNQKSANAKGKRLIEILKEFGVKATLVAISIGPSVTRFEIKPDLGVRVNKISNLQQDIKMALAASEIRIEAPIPGKSAVGIEIPNEEKSIVKMRDLLVRMPDSLSDKKLLFALGKDLSGNCIYGELNKMPHLLIAGATGSGKSVCVNSIIISLLMRTTPNEVKLLLIDPKKVEFTTYRNVPHLIAPVITDGEQAARSLKVIVKMMDKRYDLFSKTGVKNIESYCKYRLAHPDEELEEMPWIVVIIDELADLMMVASKDVEASIQRITQLARAAGIHLVVATQRPSVDVITGIIKANIPSRIAFAVSSNVDSRTIIDQNGAERLLGDGDMLYIPIGSNNAQRVQGVLVTDQEIAKISEAVSKQGKPKFEDAFLCLEASDEENEDDVIEIADPLYDEVKAFIIQSRKASTSLIQRKFSIGYARAARLIDLLEEQGIIGPSRGSKPREVLVQYQDPLAD